MTFIGYVAIVIGLITFIFSRKWLYRLLIISLPFSATAVFNVGSGENASAFQLWMFFGVLWLLREAGKSIYLFRTKIRRDLLISFAFLSIFVFVAAISLLMPLFINGSLLITSPVLLDNSTTPLYLTSRNFVALLYLIFGALIAVSLAKENQNAKHILRTERLYLGAATFVSLWGILQLACYVLAIHYPASIFNNSASPNALGYKAVFETSGLKRISSVAVEPSILAEYLLTALPLTIPALISRGQVFSKTADRLCSVVIFAVLVFTTSSIAYVGIAYLAIVSTILLTKSKIVKPRKAMIIVPFLFAAALISVVILYELIPAVGVLLDTVLFQKASGYSALERLKTISNAFLYFKQYPLLGVGWGSVTSHDLIVKLLASVGLIGFAAFVVMIIYLVVSMSRRIPYLDTEHVIQRIVWLDALSVLIFTNIVGGLSYVFGHFWCILGVSIAIASTYKGKSSRMIQNNSLHTDVRRQPNTAESI